MIPEYVSMGIRDKLKWREWKMYVYNTEILTVGTKWFSDKADANDIAMLDKLINKKAAEGWEIVTYDYMATSMQIKGAFVITFRKITKDRIFIICKTLTL